MCSSAVELQSDLSCCFTDLRLQSKMRSKRPLGFLMFWLLSVWTIPIGAQALLTRTPRKVPHRCCLGSSTVLADPRKDSEQQLGTCSVNVFNFYDVHCRLGTCNCDLAPCRVLQNGTYSGLS